MKIKLVEVPESEDQTQSVSIEYELLCRKMKC
jgi:hypothetical protein